MLWLQYDIHTISLRGSDVRVNDGGWFGFRAKTCQRALHAKTKVLTNEILPFPARVARVGGTHTGSEG